ncbi:hypothetical protein MZM54_03580 [[Brevibacterium] frigoritolerans]|nr:hypothetical protein [Peribacillus frigoritolerans]
MSNNKKLRKLMKQLERSVDMNSPAAKGVASMLEDLDLYNIKDVKGAPDKKEFMKSLVLLAVALGSEKRCQEDINNMYQSDEKKFFQFYNMTGIAKTKIFDKFSISTSECIKKCYGIIISEELGKETKGVPLFIQKLIKKAYKPVYTFNMHKKWNMLEEFIPWYEEKIGGVNMMSGVFLDRCFYVLFYISQKEEKLLIQTEMLNVVDSHFHYLLSNLTLEEVIKTEEGLTTGYEKLIKDTTFKDQISEDVSYIFENIRLLEENVLMETMEPESLGQIRQELASMPLTRITNTLILMVERFGLSGDFLREAKVGNKRLEEIAKYIYILKNSNGLTDRDAEIMFLVTLVIYAIASEYNKLREGFYEGLKVKLQEKEADEEKRETALEEKHKKEIEKLKEELRLANEKVSSLKEVSKQNVQTINQLDIEKKRLNTELIKAKENDKEIQFLREFYFRSQEEHKVPEDLSMESIQTYLSSIKGVIVGGHPNLTKKLKEKLPNFEFIAEEETSRNLSFLRNKEIVFISSVHDNHGLFYKVVKEINNANTILSYLEKHQNVDLLLRDIYEKCAGKL